MAHRDRRVKGVCLAWMGSRDRRETRAGKDNPDRREIRVALEHLDHQACQVLMVCPDHRVHLVHQG